MYFALIILLVVSCYCSTDVLQDDGLEYKYGVRYPIPVDDEHIIDVSDWAARKIGGNLTKIIHADKEIVAGLLYYIDMEVSFPENIAFTMAQHLMISFIYLYGLGLISSTDAVHISKGPENVYAVRGSQADLTCMVTDQGPQEYVLWKKVSDNNFPDMISYNDWSLNNSKYHVNIRYGRYQLSIRSVALSDEGEYECQAGGDNKRAMLNVSVPVYNMSLEWDPVKPLPRDTLVNLTCQTYHSKPPADITWLLGGRNVSENADYNKTYNDTDGFGDVTSVMQVNTGSGVAGMPFRCIALVPGQKIEHAPYLVEYVTLVGLPSGGSSRWDGALVNVFLFVITATNILWNVIS